MGGEGIIFYAWPYSHLAGFYILMKQTPKIIHVTEQFCV